MIIEIWKIELKRYIGSSGDFARITSSGKHSVVMAAGYNSMARAKIGSWITLTEARYLKVSEQEAEGACPQNILEKILQMIELKI